MNDKIMPLWALEHSQHSEDKGMYPWHISLLGKAVEDNLRDCQHNNRGANKWQIVFIGPDMESCAIAADRFDSIKKHLKFRKEQAESERQ